MKITRRIFFASEALSQSAARRPASSFSVPDKNHTQFFASELSVGFERLPNSFDAMLAIDGENLFLPGKVKEPKCRSFAISRHKLRMRGVLTNFDGQPCGFSAVNADNDGVEEVLLLASKVIGDFPLNPRLEFLALVNLISSTGFTQCATSAKVMVVT